MWNCWWNLIRDIADLPLMMSRGRSVRWESFSQVRIRWLGSNLVTIELPFAYDFIHLPNQLVKVQRILKTYQNFSLLNPGSSDTMLYQIDHNVFCATCVSYNNQTLRYMIGFVKLSELDQFWPHKADLWENSNGMESQKQLFQPGQRLFH